MDFDGFSNVVQQLVKINMASEERFGYEWNKYSSLDKNYEIQFLKWVYPLKPSFFKDKKILDAGCGMGRNSYWPLKYGAKKVMAFDFDKRSVESARKTLTEFKNATIEFKSIYDIKWQNEFDVAFSIGVIHHLKDPVLAVKKMKESVKPGGLVLIWVYGYEGNEWIVKIISPVRKLVTSRLPAGLLHFLTYFISLPFFVLINFFPFKSLYLRQLKAFGFYHVHSIIFDQLLPVIANYYKKEEAEKLLVDVGLRKVKIYSCNNNSWTVTGIKKRL